MSKVPSAEVTDSEKNELFCTYAALILHDEGKDITEDDINKLVKAAGGKVEKYWPALFAKMCGKQKDIGAFLKMGAGGGGGAAPAAAAGGGGGGGGAAPAKAAAVEEEEEEDMDFDLFG